MEELQSQSQAATLPLLTRASKRFGSHSSLMQRFAPLLCIFLHNFAAAGVLAAF